MNSLTLDQQVKYGPPSTQVFSNYLPEIITYALLPIALIVGIVIYFKKKKGKKK